ncbi:hypothetical protein HDV00_010708 [Rhizophlyctis rosea]|nr:hypothetical protein HDV00_010708 [Rhizophlyctis rosea]
MAHFKVSPDERTLQQMLSFVNSDISLHHLVSNLQARYQFLDFCVDQIEAHLSRYFDDFFVVRRGSITSKTALEATVDLDLDLVLFATNERFDYQKIDEEAENDSITRAVIFSNLLNDLYDTVVYNKDSLFEPVQKPELTRSLPLRLCLSGRKIEVDLFLKLLGKDGKLRGLGKRDGNGGRVWVEQTVDLNPIENEKRFLTEAQRCAILLVKHWKQDRMYAASAPLRELKADCEKAEKARDDLAQRTPVQLQKRGVVTVNKEVPHPAVAVYQRAKKKVESIQIKIEKKIEELDSKNIPKSYHLVLAMEASKPETPNGKPLYCLQEQLRC